MNQFIKLPKLILDDWLHPEVEHPWGVIVIAGEAGTGKTITMTDYALRVAPQLYPDVELKIFTNFDLAGQTGSISSVSEIVEAPRDSIILIDESSNWFDARRYASFPPEMMQPLTQHRHMDVQLIMTAQAFNHIDARIRELCTSIVEVRTFMNRLTSADWYRVRDYEKIENKDDEFKHGKAYRRYSFVQTPELRAAYDTKHEYIRALLREHNNSYNQNLCHEKKSKPDVDISSLAESTKIHPSIIPNVRSAISPNA